MTGATASFDPLVEPVDHTAVSAFARELRQSGRVPPAFGGAFVTVIAAFVFVVVGFMIVTTLIAVIGSIVATLSSSGGLGGVGFALLFSSLPFLVIPIALVVAALGFRRLFGNTSERRYRLDRFARANGMTYVPQLQAPALPGMIFGIGSARQSSDLVRGERPRFVEFGNYTYTTGSGKNRSTHQWGYVAVKLDVPLPHIVLDATGNNSLFGSNLPSTFSKGQRLSLEGDFDDHFALYCPVGYERDALYLFTPDIMARFIDNAAALDVEIVDDWLFLYAKRPMSTLDPATWAWLFSVVGALLDKFAQWARWRDERLRAEARAETDAAPPASVVFQGASAMPFAVPAAALRPPPGVAAQGQRLKRGIPWAGIVVAGVVVLVWLLGQFGFFGFLLGGLFGP